ncbi:MAG: hypothetical protein ACRDOJ_14145, partial [Nocardioidaceae bacterium]
MIPMTLAEIAEAVGGRVESREGGGSQAHDTSVRVTGAAFVDSRVPEAGGLFVAVAGEHVDGHDYAAAAVEA